MTNALLPHLTEWIEKPPYSDWPKEQKRKALAIFEEFMAMDTDCGEIFINDLLRLVEYAKYGEGTSDYKQR